MNEPNEPNVDLDFRYMDGRPALLLTVKGLVGLDDAEWWGHQEAARESVKRGEPVFLSRVWVDSQNWIMLVSPQSYEGRGIEVVSRRPLPEIKPEHQ